MALDRAISNLIADGELTGKEGEIVQLHTMGKIAPKRVVVVGLGKKEKFDEDTVRRVMGRCLPQPPGEGREEGGDNSARGWDRWNGCRGVGVRDSRGQPAWDVQVFQA